MWYEHRDHLPWIMKTLDLRLPYVECGVLDGDHLDHVKSIWGGQCIGVAPYQQVDMTRYPDGANMSQGSLDAMFHRVQMRHDIRRLHPLDAVSQFEDSSLGCVYLDHNHSYRYVSQEMEAWWPKVADGGLLVGDDFWSGMSHDRKTWFAVCRAALDFAKRHELALMYTSDNRDWYFLKRPYFQPHEILVVSNMFGDWPSCVADNHQAYCDHYGYTYAHYDVPPPEGFRGPWSKIRAIQKAWDEHPDKKFLWWIDADIVFMTPRPLHEMAFHGFGMVGGAYRSSQAREGSVNGGCFGMCMSAAMRRIIDEAPSRVDPYYRMNFPYEEAAFRQMLKPRDNPTVLLTDMDHIAPTLTWNAYSSHSWMHHAATDIGACRKAVLQDLCAMSRFAADAHHIASRRVIPNRNDIAAILPPNLVGAELGVFEGDYSQVLLASGKFHTLYCVDCFDNKPTNFDRVYADGSVLESLVRDRFKDDPRVQVIKSDSIAFLQSMQGTGLDFVYIDTLHDHSHTLAELEAAALCCNRGGYICGHDYCDKHPGVISAVAAFSRKYDIELTITHDSPNNSFVIRLNRAW